MADRIELEARISFCKRALEKLREAYIKLADGGVKSYMIDDRQVTKLDLPALADEIDRKQRELDAYEAQLMGQRPRKAFGVLPRDY